MLETSTDVGADPYGLSTYVFGGSSWSAPATIALLTDHLNATNFGSITIQGSGQGHPVVNMAQGSVLTVAPGGSVSLSGVETIDGTINAPSGRISLTGYTYDVSQANGVQNPKPLTIGSSAVLNVAGLWVNDLVIADGVPQSAAFINGGSVNISTNAAVYHAGTNSGTGRPDESNNIDVTQSIVLAPGSIIDLSGGGHISPSGKFTGGTGGNLSLVTYAGGGFTGLSLDGLFHYNERPTDGNEPNAATLFRRRNHLCRWL